MLPTVICYHEENKNELKLQITLSRSHQTEDGRCDAKAILSPVARNGAMLNMQLKRSWIVDNLLS